MPDEEQGYITSLHQKEKTPDTMAERFRSFTPNYGLKR
jgi:hypothetical protein